jgi:hypothetical protein
MEGKRTRTKGELEACMRKHLGFIQRSCEMYDAGWESEAERIAVSLRVLFHGTDVSRPLVGQLHLSGGKMISTLDPAHASPGLLGLAKLGRAGKPAMPHMVPRLGCGGSLNRVDLRSWWEGECIYGLAEAPVTRKDLVLSLANRDGAHTDPELAQLDDMLRTNWQLTVSFEADVDGCGPKKSPDFHFDNALHANVRQIACEVLDSPFIKRFLARVEAVESSGVPPFDDSGIVWETVEEYRLVD